MRLSALLPFLSTDFNVQPLRKGGCLFLHLFLGLMCYNAMWSFNVVK